MTQPETTSVTQALAAARAEMPSITRDQTGQVGTRHYRYADLASVTAAVEPVLARHGLLWLTLPDVIDGARFVLRWRLLHEASGTELAGLYPIGGNGPQEIGSCLTYSRRYSLVAVLGLAPAGDDDDGASATAARRRRRAELEQDQAQDGVSTHTDSPGSASSGQLRQLGIALSDYGLSDRAERLQFVAGMVGRPLSSSKELSVREARSVINTVRAQLADRPAGGQS